MAYDLGLAERVQSVLGQHPGFSERKMFGGICFMINGHMCCGVVKADLMLRLTPEAVTKGLKRPHTRAMDFTRKPMQSMMFVGVAGTDSDNSLQKWIESALAVVLTLPPKKPSAKKPSAR